MATYRLALLGLSVLALSLCIASARTLDDSDFWISGAARTKSSDTRVKEPQSAASGQTSRRQARAPARAAAPAKAAPAAAKATPASAGKPAPAPAAKTTPAVAPAPAATAPAATVPSSSATTAQRYYSSGTAPTVTGSILPGLETDLPRLVIGSDGDRMSRITKDIRGLNVNLNSAPLLVSTTFPKGLQPADPALGGTVSAFTYTPDLLCTVGVDNAVTAGWCDLAATVLPPETAGLPALTQVSCMLNENAKACDPQCRSGMNILATGRTYVVPNATDPGLVQSFATQNSYLLVDGIYTEGRPETLLSGIIGFNRGSLQLTVQHDTTQAGLYRGVMTFNLYKGPF